MTVPLAAAPAPKGTVTFTIAPTGSDKAAGTSKAPFASLKRAQEAIRELKKRQGGQLKQPVSVVLRGGTYYLQSPLTFTPADSGTEACPITYKPFSGERVVISGGRRLGPWQAKADGLWHAALPVNGENFRRLRLGETDAIRARTPNFDPKNPHTGGWWFSQDGGVAWERGALGVVVGNAQEVGSSLSWRVKVPTTANYTVWVRYAHNMKMEMGGRTTLSSGDAAPVPLENLPDTGDWGHLQWSEVGTLPLGEGNQTLTWKNAQGGGLNLDAFVLTDDANWSPNNADSRDKLPAPATGQHSLLIECEATIASIGPVSIPREIEGGPSNRIGLTKEQLTTLGEMPKDAEVNIFPAWGWVNARMKVDDVDAGQPALLVRSQESIWQNNRFYVENLRSALDSPGEWFLDKTRGEVLYKPHPTDKLQSPTIVPVMDRLLILAGNAGANRFVKNLRFEGLTFADTDYTLGGYYSQTDSALWLQAAKDCDFRRCHFQHLGGYAIRMEQRSNGNYIENCTMAGLGGGGVVMLGDTKSQPFHNRIAANDIHDCGQIYAHVAGVYVTTGSDNKILNNSIKRMPRYGVSLKSFSEESYSHDNVVAYNEIVDTNLDTNDTGAIETLGRDKQDSGNCIEYNLIRNVVGLKVTTDGVIHTPYFTWGIYLDDWSSGTRVQGNVVDGTVVGALCIHGGKNNIVQNNIFLNGSEMNIRFQPRGDGFMADNTFRRNIVAYKNPDALLWYSSRSPWEREYVGEVTNNVYWCFGGLDLATTDKNITPLGPWTKWRDSAQDSRSMIADPQFVDLNHGNYRLKPTSPALKLGFGPIPFQRIGPKGYDTTTDVVGLPR